MVLIIQEDTTFVAMMLNSEIRSKGRLPLFCLGPPTGRMRDSYSVNSQGDFLVINKLNIFVGKTDQSTGVPPYLPRVAWTT